MWRAVLLSGATVLVLMTACAQQEVAEEETAAAVATMDAPPPPPEPEPQVPLTITMPQSTGGAGGPVTGVSFEIGGTQTQTYDRDPDHRIQYKVGDVPLDGDQYTFDVTVTRAGGSQTSEVHLDALAYCSETPDEPLGKLIRISCAASAPGDGPPPIPGPFGAVCSGIYQYSAAPPDTCTGTYACKKCRSGVRVCSEDPQCVD